MLKLGLLEWVNFVIVDMASVVDFDDVLGWDLVFAFVVVFRVVPFPFGLLPGAGTGAGSADRSCCAFSSFISDGMPFFAFQHFSSSSIIFFRFLSGLKPNEAACFDSWASVKFSYCGILGSDLRATDVVF